MPEPDQRCRRPTSPRHRYSLTDFQKAIDGFIESNGSELQSKTSKWRRKSSGTELCFPLLVQGQLNSHISANTGLHEHNWRLLAGSNISRLNMNPIGGKNRAQGGDYTSSAAGNKGEVAAMERYHAFWVLATKLENPPDFATSNLPKKAWIILLLIILWLISNMESKCATCKKAWCLLFRPGAFMLGDIKEATFMSRSAFMLPNIKEDLRKRSFMMVPRCFFWT